MPIFLPAVILGIIFFILGSSILIFRSKAGAYAKRRYAEQAQRTDSTGYVPGPGFVVALGIAVIAIGIIAIIMGLSTDWDI
ncbi:hypothetical protein [Arthrobacter sp. HLT1-21]